jgi:enoyl-CoA hydratase
MGDAPAKARSDQPEGTLANGQTMGTQADAQAVSSQADGQAAWSQADGQAVWTQADGPVLTITLHRPQARNAVDGPTAAALHAAFTAFEADERLHVAVLHGAGGTFCAGADLKAMADPQRRNAVEPTGTQPGPMGPTRMELSKPVIAAVEGHAVAGGLELALMCDLRVAARGAVFGVFCRRWGVPLIDGGTVRLPRLVGMGRALDLILTGRAVDAAEALAIGLADRIVDDGQALAAAQALAREIAAFPQACLRADRASAYAQWDLGLAQALRQEGARGYEVVHAEGLAGAARFAAGAGRHGRPADQD